MLHIPMIFPWNHLRRWRCHFH